jgi:eukaryotic-like serine/threonine-protein kinase
MADNKDSPRNREGNGHGGADGDGHSPADSVTPDASGRTPVDGTPDPVATLIAAGDHVSAAQLAARQGDLRRAIALYERSWRFADALPLALTLGDRPLAIRLALDAGNAGMAAQIGEQIPREAGSELRAAARSFAARGDNWEAARMAERAGDAALAAGYFQRAGSLLDVGRMEEIAGRPHQAGIAYEQALSLAANAGEAGAAHLAVGRLLARLGRHQDAARSLQQAMRVPSLSLPAGRALTAELLALGFRVAAAEIVVRLRRLSPELPNSPEEIAALDAAELAASSSAVGQIAAAPGLLRHRFKVVRSLGAGATSHVYLAEDILIGQAVALKLLSVGAGAHGAERQAYLRFAREAEAAGRLRHPNIVTLHDADPAMGLFVLEMMPGGTLADRLAESGALSPLAARRLALDLLSALGAAHDHGIVHRDVKPANILFDSVGNAKLGDFGAAHLADFGHTQTGGLLGTVAYMAPEQITGAGIGPPADLYALGITLFQTLTGRLPFAGPDIVAQHLGDDPPRPSACRAGLSAAHDAVLMRALRKAPGERWRSAGQMAEAIEAWPVGLVDSAAGAGPALATSIASEGTGIIAADATADVPLGRTAFGALFRRDDPDLGRPVLIEIRDQPVQGEALAILRALSAEGGPHVQRVLALSDDDRTVTYELCEGRVLAVGHLAPDDAAILAEARIALGTAGVPAPARPDRVAMTPGGPVLLIVEPLEDSSQPARGPLAPRST